MGRAILPICKLNLPARNLVTFCIAIYCSTGGYTAGVAVALGVPVGDAVGDALTDGLGVAPFLNPATITTSYTGDADVVVVTV